MAQPILRAKTGGNRLSSDNSTDSALDAGNTFTGTAEDVSAYDSVVVAVATDQDGSFTVQFSNDAINWDSTLTRYYRTGEIEAPHRFTITRRYVRVTFTNSSASNQTYLRMQTVFGAKSELNAPIDSTLARDFDATAVRPTDFKSEVGLGRRQGSVLWNKFGYNDSIGTGSPEVIASWGGTFNPMTTARTLSIVSTDANDDGDPAGTGANSVIVYGVDENREEQTVTVTLNGTTPVVTTEQWLGVNRMSVALAGSGQENAGTITATATTDLTTQAQIPAGQGTSQQCIFFTSANRQALAEWLTLTVIRFGSGTEPVVTLKGWVYSAVSNGRYEVVRKNIDSALSNELDLSPPLPFVIGEQSCFWLEAETSRANTELSARFSLIEHKDPDA